MSHSLVAILFAEDLLKFIFEKHSLKYVPSFKYEMANYQEDKSLSPFRSVLGNAVYKGIASSFSDLVIIFVEEFKGIMDVLLFKRLLIKLTPRWFPEGYNPICFIEYCIMVCSVAIFCHSACYEEISSCAGEVIANVLTQCMLTNEFYSTGGWDKLVKESIKMLNLPDEAISK